MVNENDLKALRSILRAMDEIEVLQEDLCKLYKLNDVTQVVFNDTEECKAQYESQEIILHNTKLHMQAQIENRIRTLQLRLMALNDDIVELCTEGKDYGELIEY